MSIVAFLSKTDYSLIDAATDNDRFFIIFLENICFEEKFMRTKIVALIISYKFEFFP